MFALWKLARIVVVLATLVWLVAVGPVPALANASLTVAPTTFAPLTLVNGWLPSPFGTATPAVGVQSGVVYLKGAIATSGSNPVPFTLPAAARPASVVFVPVNLCNANPGVLQIEPTGVVTVEAAGGTFANARCFTSLDGASYALHAPTPLTVQNGWINAPFGTSHAAAVLIGGVVHLKGAIATTGTNPEPFVLPVAMRPAHDTYVRVDLCNANTGRLFIEGGTGVVAVQTPSFANAACFTSLDGASYALHAPTALRLSNGWSDAPFNTSDAAATVEGGIVHLQGAIATTGTDPRPFILRKALRPRHTAYVPVDLCSASVGDIEIEPNGTTVVQALNSFSDAQCFTSLDGVTYAQ